MVVVGEGTDVQSKWNDRLNVEPTRDVCDCKAHVGSILIQWLALELGQNHSGIHRYTPAFRTALINFLYCLPTVSSILNIIRGPQWYCRLWKLQLDKVPYYLTVMTMRPKKFQVLVLQCKDLASILPTPKLTPYFCPLINRSQTMLALYSTFIRPYIGRKDASILANSAKA